MRNLNFPFNFCFPCLIPTIFPLPHSLHILCDEKNPSFVFPASFVKTGEVCVCFYCALRSASCFLLLSHSSLQASPHSVQSSAEPLCAFLSSTQPLHDPGHLCMPQSPAPSGVSEVCLELRISKATT